MELKRYQQELLDWMIKTDHLQIVAVPRCAGKPPVEHGFVATAPNSGLCICGRVKVHPLHRGEV